MMKGKGEGLVSVGSMSDSTYTSCVVCGVREGICV